MSGYDLGGAEYPYDPESLTVVDILTPEPDYEADYYRRDLNDPNWTAGLEPRSFIYIGRTLRYLNNPNLAKQVSEIWNRVGTITIFDDLPSIQPFLQRLLEIDNDLKVEIELINSDANDPEYVPDWNVIISRIET